MPSRYAADFETTTVAPCKVWCWGVANVETPDKVEVGRTIDEFIEWCKDAKNPTIYFHNEKFDGSFILDYLLRNGYTWKKDKGKCCENDFTTIIDNFGKFYAIEIYWSRKGHKVNKCTIYDSFKLIPMSVDRAAKNFGLEISKLHIDYDRHNTPCPITKEEWEYLEHDVSIMAQVLQIAFRFGLTKMTLAGCCLKDYKDIVTTRRFSKWFPQPPIPMDTAMRKAYKGGWTYANPDNCGHDVGEGLVFDVNSLYPSQMRDRPLPWGTPVWYRGKYREDVNYPLYIQKFVCAFELKENFLPMLQLKGYSLFNGTEYLKSSKGHRIELTLASPDVELFFRHYNTDKVEWIGGWKFWSSTELFKDYVNKWAETKIQADKDGNKALRQIAKLFMNSLYGRFAINPLRKSKYPVFNEEKDCVQYKPILTACTYADGTPQLDEQGNQMYTDVEIGKPVYIPVGIFITAWARYTTISAAQKIHYDSIVQTGKSRFCYADTDSLHIIGTEIPEGLDVDPYRLGAWKCESHFTHAKFIQAKRYVEVIDGELKVTCAGLPHESHKYVTFENFHNGTTYPGKLVPKTVPGGIMLVEVPFQMKEPARKEKNT